MSEHEFNNQNTQEGSQPMSPGALVRAAADGELTASDQRRFDELSAESPEVADQVAFEQRLRAATGRIMGDVTVPEGLAARIREAVAADDELDEQLDHLAPQTRSVSFWSRRSWIGAMAAVLVLGVSAALIFQATRITRVELSADQMAYRQQLASFLTERHDQCCVDLHNSNSSLTLSDPTEFEKAMTERLGRPVDVPSSTGTGSVRFAGGAPCHVPGEGPSGHSLYEADFGPEISVFVKPDNGELPLKPGRVYALNTKECGLPGARILTTIRDGVMYFFVFNEGPGCQKALDILGVGTPSAKF